MSISLKITTPYGRIFDGEVKAVTLPGSEGEFGALEGHSDLFTLLKAGVIEVDRDTYKNLIVINWGYAKVSAKQVDVLVDDAVMIGDEKGDIADSINSAKKLLQDATDDKVAFSSVVSRIDNAKGR